MNKTTFSLLALSGLVLAPMIGAASCGGDDLDNYPPPDGLGGYDPSGGPPPNGASSSNTGVGGSGGMVDPGPPMCDDSLKRCEHEFTLADTGQTTVELRGDFSPTGWMAGVPMTKAGGQWAAKVEVPYNAPVQYKFVQDGTWINDPANPNQIDDGFGGKNSLFAGKTCDPWTCAPAMTDDKIEAWRDEVLYFVFVDRFLDGDATNNGAPTPGVQKPADYQGGDWKGVMMKLDEGYFNKLGVTSLWLTVPVDNTEASGQGVGETYNYSAYHGYWPKDFYKAEEHFGTMIDLKALVDLAHSKGIKVLIDYAANHAHDSAPIYQMNMSWFWPNNNGSGGNCVCGQGCGWDDPAKTEKCWFTPYLPDFNYENADARKYNIDNAVWWFQQTGIDGFRLDALKHMSITWLTELRARVKSDIESVTNTHFYMVGETYTGDKGLINKYVDPNSMLDGQFDFPLRAEIVSKVLSRQGTMQDLEGFMNGNDNSYGIGIMSTFIGNHDLPRPIHAAQNAPIWQNAWDGGKDRAWTNLPGLPGEQAAFERLANGFTILMTTRGVPLIYYGDEIGLPGAGDPDNRRFMQWSNYSAGQTLLRTHIEKLGQIRKDHVALRRGKREGLWAQGDVMAYKMSNASPADTVYVAINRGDAQASVSGLPSGALTNLLNNQTVTGPTINLPPRTSMILIQ
jgi:glycosidase